MQQAERAVNPDPDRPSGARPHAEEAYRWLAPPVLAYLRGQGAADPEDLLGEVFYQVARDLDRVDGDADAVRRWVFTIARHRLIDDRRRRAVRPLLLWREVPEPPPQPPPVEPMDAQLVSALGDLTRSQREVVVLRFVADLPLADVAAITRRPVGAVKAMQRRGLDRLRTALAAPSG